MVKFWQKNRNNHANGRELTKELVNAGTEEEMTIEGYQTSLLQQILAYVLYLITAGLLRLVFHWQPVWMLKMTHRRCQLHASDKVLLQDQYKNLFVSSIKTATKEGTRVKVIESSSVFFCRTKQNTAASVEDLSLIKYFVCKKIKYIWQPENGGFVKLGGLEAGHTCAGIHDLAQTPLTDMERRRRLVLYGENAMDIHVTPIVRLLVREMLTPLYIFQLFSCILWFTDEYEIYAACILLISAGFISHSIYGTRRVERDLRGTVESYGFVSVRRGENYQNVTSNHLVPGDLIDIPRHGCVMHCDAVLLTGNCIVNENMLTGESVPITKTPLMIPEISTKFSVKDHAKNILFCGTKVIQTRFYRNHKVTALVIRTGYMTTKGELVRSILFPKPEHFRFSQDVLKFIIFLASLASIGFVFTIILMALRGSSVSLIVRRALDLVTIVVPPALPAAMKGSSLLARERLKKCKIACISPNSITVCGAVNLVCFDKTGTLTEDGLDLKVVVPCDEAKFGPPVGDPFPLPKDHLSTAMATCHSLTNIEGELSGDPLDLKMFEGSKWAFEELNEDDVNYDSMMPTVVRPPNEEENPMEDVGIVRQFTFSSKLQRMSVVTKRVLDKHFMLYVKGSPEKIVSFCKPGTVPADFHTVLSRYTQQGHRVIAMAWRNLNIRYKKIQRVQREDVERDLNFIGLLVMENRVKSVTAPTIRLLNSAKIRTLMITGDNLLTALSVGRECHLIGPQDKVIVVQVTPPENQNNPKIEYISADDDARMEMGSKDELIIPVEESKKRIHFAMTGKSWELLNKHYPQLLPKISVRGTIFARMAPEQKAQLIERLQDLGYYVTMCGDGANDCAALKSAHVGISLSEAEASIASPFTSEIADVRCVPVLIREGRCALVTSLGIFKYTASYSLTQFSSVLILYWISCNFTDMEFVYIDLLILTSLCITFSLTEAYEDLVPKRPPISLISISPVLSLILQMVIIIGIQAWAFFNIQTQPWFVPYVPNEEEEHYSYENGAVFLVSIYQYLILAVVFSQAQQYRKSIFSNYYFLANLGILLALSLFISINPPHAVTEFMELRLPESTLYRLIYVGIALANFLACYVLEKFVIQNPKLGKLARKLKRKITKPTKDKYVELQHEMDVDPSWPPVSPSSITLAELTKFEFQPANDEPPRRRTLSGMTNSSIDEEDRPLVSAVDADGDRVQLIVEETSSANNECYIGGQQTSV